MSGRTPCKTHNRLEQQSAAREFSFRPSRDRSRCHWDPPYGYIQAQVPLYIGSLPPSISPVLLILCMCRGEARKCIYGEGIELPSLVSDVTATQGSQYS